jgi:hypothetical protein
MPGCHDFGVLDKVVLFLNSASGIWNSSASVVAKLCVAEFLTIHFPMTQKTRPCRGLQNRGTLKFMLHSATDYQITTAPGLKRWGLTGI